MSDLLTIRLNNLRFFAYHGLYAEERKTGNEFEVNLAVSYIPAQRIITDLDDTINYVKLHSLLKEEMQQHRGLLETFVMELADKIHIAFPMVKKVEICIDKLHPPIAQFTGSVGVSLTKEW